MIATEYGHEVVPHAIAPRLLWCSVEFKSLADEIASKLLSEHINCQVASSYVTAGHDAFGQACFHIWYRPRWQLCRLSTGRTLLHVYPQP